MRGKSWSESFSTLLGVGRVGWMSGTAGSAAALLILLAAGGINPVVLILVIVTGTFAADRYAKESGTEDPGEVVIDEVAGFWTSMEGLDASSAIAAFFLFRVIDIVKPFPVDKMEKLPGGVGIMADDVCGGLMVNAILRLASWLLYSGGVDAIHKYFEG
ncbi:MAG: phosphatidylglycerophosphatase A, partial [Synergistaceae bacterium]|nr:phosphatidylglycerophosphatase A [Synergistaceae bacterium]